MDLELNKYASPGEALAELLKNRSWSQTDLATILGKPQRSISEIITGKKGVTPETAIALATAFGNDPEFWLSLESKYRLSLTDLPGSDIEERARLFNMAPIKEMIKRGWIESKDDVSELAGQLNQFFEHDCLMSAPEIKASLRSSFSGDMNPAQTAWCYRAKWLAKAMKVADYDERNFDTGIKKLRRLASWPDHAAKVPAILANMGIRFVVVEPIAKTRIDGAAFWLDCNSPVIAMSARYDRIDNFWHTLGHELSHIKHRDSFALDIDIMRDSAELEGGRSDIEQRADTESCGMWIDQDAFQSFIVRVGPLYSRDRVIQFANRIKIHPGLIVGQLQGRGEIGFQSLRDQLVKIREHVTCEAITDGWGHVVS